jgi:hypothetical protein
MAKLKFALRSFVYAPKIQSKNLSNIFSITVILTLYILLKHNTDL